MPLTPAEREWYFDQIERADAKGRVVAVDRTNDRVTYTPDIRSDESLTRDADAEECVRALAVALLARKPFLYPPEMMWIEKHIRHGHPGSMKDEVDLIIEDGDGLPFAMWEFKSAEEYGRRPEDYIRYQLFGTAPLVGAPRFLVYATIRPTGDTPTFTAVVIDYTKWPAWDGWDGSGRPQATDVPENYSNPTYQPLARGGPLDLRTTSTQADFRAVAATIHAEFFGEHPDNQLFTNVVKCLLAKIFDERQTKQGTEYEFQVKYKGGKEESAKDVFDRINKRYREAYTRYIEPGAPDADDINPREFPPERVKTVVKALEGMSITRGAALHGDVIGAFFEEILRTGFKQDKGMYFTHANLVTFMLEAIDLDGLTVSTWKASNHPENRLPYIIDPACGSGSFLLRAMHMVSRAIRTRRAELVDDAEAEQFFTARMSDDQPNYWAESFIYGIDPKFIMAIIAKVNMVLHGDGSAHIFKNDALLPLGSYSDDKLKPTSAAKRSITQGAYMPPLSESFDVVVSNPPFGVTLSTETKRGLASAFSMKKSAASESLFLERWFQLLKPGGRLGVVLPESLLNTGDSADVRLFLYRMFWIRAIVGLPRNLFIDTPTLTSLLFAQKKTAAEIVSWDDSWRDAELTAKKKLEEVRSFVKKGYDDPLLTPVDIEKGVISRLAPLVNETTTVLKKGRAVLKFRLPPGVPTREGACGYYADLMGLAGTRQIVRNWIFDQVAAKHDYEYSVYEVDEVGFKLSKRKERPRPNQLCHFVDADTKEEVPNLHLATGDVDIHVDLSNGDRVLDDIRRSVKWH